MDQDPSHALGWEITRMRKVIYWSVLRYLFNSVHIAEVGALEGVRDILREWECPLDKSVPSCSVGGLWWSWSYSLVMCDLTKFKSCIRSQPRGEQDPRQSHMRRAIFWHWPQDICYLVQAQGGGDRGWGGKLWQATYKTVISKWYQKVSKHFKKL